MNPCPKCGESHDPIYKCPLVVKEAHHWSRHYDLIQWTAMGIFWAAIGTLYVQFLDAKSPGEGGRLLGIALFLTALSFFTLLNFRGLRRQVQTDLIPAEHHDAFRSKLHVKQGPVHIAIHGAIAIALLIEIHSSKWIDPCWTIGGGLIAGFVCLFFFAREVTGHRGK